MPRCEPGCICGRHSRLSTEERFWSKVDRSGDCWLWMASLDGKGYGQFRLDGRHPWKAHRVAYMLTHGIDDRMVDHRPTCPKTCVNPEHLRLATNKQNGENRAGAQSNNRSSGIRGVYWNGQCNKWMVKAWHDGKPYYGGLFDHLADAEAAAIALRNRLFTHNDLDRAS